VRRADHLPTQRRRELFVVGLGVILLLDAVGLRTVIRTIHAVLAIAELSGIGLQLVRSVPQLSLLGHINLDGIQRHARFLAAAADYPRQRQDK
jgi:hypothetical protein